MDATARPAVIATANEPAAIASTFGDFYRRHYRSVVSLVFALSGSRTAAEELAQDAFIKAHDRWDTVRAHPDPEAWVKRVAINLARSWGRRKLIEAKALARLKREPINVIEMDAPAERLWQHVRRLPGNQAAAIALRYHDDQSIESIAEVIGCSPATVRVHLHRGRKALATSLDLSLDDDDYDYDDAAAPEATDTDPTSEK